MIKQLVLAVSFLVTTTTSAQVTQSLAPLQAIQNSCSQLLNSPVNTILLQSFHTYADDVQTEELKAAIFATYAMGMFYSDQIQVASKTVQSLQQAFPSSPHLAAFQFSQYQTDCARCSGSGNVEIACARCGGKGTCSGCGGRGTIAKLNRQTATCTFCRGSGQCPSCKGSSRETAKCPQCFGRRKITSKALMKSAYMALIQKTKTLAFAQEQAAKGLVEFEGQWITPADKQREMDKRAALAKAQQAEELARERAAEEEKRLREVASKDNAPVVQKAEVQPAGSDEGGVLSKLRVLAEKGGADDQYNLGVYYDNGQDVPQSHAEAAKWYRKAAEQGHANALYNLGVCYANGQGMAKDLQTAHGWFAKAIAAGSKDAVGALQYIETKLSPSQILETRNRTHVEMRGNLPAVSGSTDGNEFKKDETTGPAANSPNNDALIIGALIKTGDWKGAKVIAEARIKNDPKAAICLFVVDAAGLVTKTRKPPIRATVDYPYGDKACCEQLRIWTEALLAADPKNANYLMLNGLCSVLGRKDFERGLALFEKVLKSEPDNVVALGLVGAGYGAQRRLDDAIKVSEKAIRLDPDCAQAYSNLGMAQITQGNRAKAEEYFKKAVSCSDADAMDWFNLGGLYSAQGRLEEGKEALLKAVAICPNLYPPHWNLASVYYSLGMKADCIRECKKVIELAPDSVEGQKAQRNLQALGN